MTEEAQWKKCSICKEPINFKSNYLKCSVSTCNSKRAGMVFCSVKCWDSHVPIMRHREAFYSELKSPISFQAEQDSQITKSNVIQEKKEIKKTSPSIIVRKKT